MKCSKIGLLLCLAVNTASCKESSLLETISTSTEKKINQSTDYLNALLLQSKGKYDKALKIYSGLLSKDASPYIYDGYLRLLSRTNQFDTIVGLIDKTDPTFKNDLEIQLIYAESLLSTNKNEQAESLLNDLRKKYPTNDKVAYYMSAYHEKTNNLEKAIADIDLFLKNQTNKHKKFLFLFLKSKILLKMNRFEDAIKAINESIKAAPGFSKAFLLKAHILERMNKPDEAIKVYNKILKISPGENDIRKHVVQLLYLQSKFADAAKNLKKIKDKDAQHLFNIAFLYWKSKDYKNAIKYVDRSLKSDPLFLKSKLLNIELLMATKEYQKALDFLREWIVANPNDNSLVHTFLLLCNKGMPVDLARKTLESIHAQDPNRENIILAIADLSLQADDFKKAMEFCTKILSQTQNESLKSKMRFQIAFIQNIIGKKEEALNTLDQAMNQKIVYDSCYNLKASILSDLGKLDAALVVIEKARTVEPQSPYVMDTEAEIYFKKGNFRKSAELLEEAVKIEPNNPIIRQHLEKAKEHLR